MAMVWQTMPDDGAPLLRRARDVLCATVHLQVANNLPPLGEEPWSAACLHWTVAGGTCRVLIVWRQGRRHAEDPSARARPGLAWLAVRRPKVDEKKAQGPDGRFRSDRHKTRGRRDLRGRRRDRLSPAQEVELLSPALFRPIGTECGQCTDLFRAKIAASDKPNGHDCKRGKKNV